MNRFDRRRNRFYEELGASHPCLIVYSRHRLYLSDTVRPGLLYVSPEERVMYSTRAYERSEQEADVDDIIRVNSTGEALEQIDRRLGEGDTIGLESQKIPATMRDRFREELTVKDTVDVTGALRRTRIKKDERELDYLREASKQSDEAHRRARAVLRSGMEEVEFAAEVESAARSAGHEGIMTHGRFDAYLPYGLISSGPNLAEMGSYAYVSHGTGPTRAFPVSAGHRVIEENDPVVVDIGGVHYGYNADVSRTYVAGPEPSTKIRDAHDALEGVCREIEQELTAGTPASTVYERGVNVADKTEFSDYFQGYGEKKGPFVGHGIGLEIDEPPILGPRNDRPVPENATVTIEIFFVFPEEGAVKIEESCRVRSGAPPEILSSIPRELFMVGNDG